MRMKRWALPTVIVAGLGIASFIGRSTTRAVHEVDGTVVSIDPSKRTAKLEVIDPANGATRRFDGVVPEMCTITVNGNPAALAELRPGDIVHVRARSDRRGSRSDNDRQSVITAEEIHVKRSDRESR